MFKIFIETLSWGVTGSTAALISGLILDFDLKSIRNIMIGSFILGCIRGYTGKNIITLLLIGA